MLVEFVSAICAETLYSLGSLVKLGDVSKVMYTCMKELFGWVKK